MIIGFAPSVLSKCSRVPAPSPPSPCVPMLPWWHMLLYVVAACVTTALLVPAAFASFIWHQRAHHWQRAHLAGTAQAAGLPGGAFSAQLDGNTEGLISLVRLWHGNEYADAGQCAACILAWRGPPSTQPFEKLQHHADQQHHPAAAACGPRQCHGVP